MGIKKIVRLFDKGNVMVCGMMGTGKDVLFGNVIQRRKRPYISNLDYGGDRIIWKPWMMNFNNTWKNLMEDQIRPYVHIFPDRVDVYLSDAGIYMPAQNHNELYKGYGHIPTSIPMMRQVAGSWYHCNCQNPSRIWIALREQSDIFLLCKWCHVLFGKLVIQSVVEYERFDSCSNRVPVFPLRRPLLNADRIQAYEIQKANYEISHGSVKPHLLIYWNKSKHNTRGFKEMFADAGGVKNDA